MSATESKPGLSVEKNKDEDKDSLFSSEESEGKFIAYKFILINPYNKFTSEKAVKVQSPETEDLQPEQKYNDEELTTLVSYMKDLTILYDLRPSDWSTDCEQIIRYWVLTLHDDVILQNHNSTDVDLLDRRYWLTNLTEPLLMVFFDGAELTCDTFVPTVPIIDATYFLRPPGI